MAPKADDSALLELLTSFNATWLGEGNINAGTNLLVARAVTLSNLSRTGCGIQLPKLNRLSAGCSLLVNGGHSSSLVSEIVTEVGISQNNLTAQLSRLIGNKIAEARKKGQKTIAFPSGPAANAAESALFQLEHKDAPTYSDPQEQWARVLHYPPNPRIEDLAARPKFLVTAKGSRDLEKQLNGLQGNRPLVFLSLNEPKDASSYADTCNALLNGPYPVGDFGETVMGNLLVSDRGNVLGRIAPNGGDKAAWLGRFVWLVDGALGPDAAENAPEPGTFHVSDTDGRFGEALSVVLASRLNNHDAGTTTHTFKLAEAQARWVNFLMGMEGRLPGITGTARGLLATLAFGLIELAKAPNCKPLSVTPEGVEALGRWVIQRMANARVAMLSTAEMEQMRQLAQRILWKLGEGKIKARDLYRSVGITVARFEEVFSVLEPAGLVRRVDGYWERLNKGPLLEAEMEELFLEG